MAKGNSGWTPRISGPRVALEAAEARAEPWQAVGAIRLLALTGCRKGEIRKLLLTEVDLQGRCLRLGDTKTGQSIRPLGEPALRVLRSFLNRPNRPTSKFVFPGRDPRKPFNGFGGATEGAWRRIVGGEYSAHGLRHAFASACDELGSFRAHDCDIVGSCKCKERIDNARLHQEARCCATGGCRFCQRVHIKRDGRTIPRTSDRVDGCGWRQGLAMQEIVAQRELDDRAFKEFEEAGSRRDRVAS